VQLACDATGRCAIANDERSAGRRAVLVYGDDGWTLEARDAKDQPLWTLALGTTDDDARLRKAGVWIARSEGGPTIIASRSDAATDAQERSPRHTSRSSWSGDVRLRAMPKPVSPTGAPRSNEEKP
jgi:hypothetical protein